MTVSFFFFFNGLYCLYIKKTLVFRVPYFANPLNLNIYRLKNWKFLMAQVRCRMYIKFLKHIEIRMDFSY